jgi:hypothetical protein
MQGTMCAALASVQDIGIGRAHSGTSEGRGGWAVHVVIIRRNTLPAPFLRARATVPLTICRQELGAASLAASAAIVPHAPSVGGQGVARRLRGSCVLFGLVVEREPIARTEVFADCHAVVPFVVCRSRQQEQ